MTMIRQILLAFTIVCSPAAFAGTLVAGEVQLSTPGVGSQFPDVAYANGVIHVVWVGYAAGKLGDIYYSKSSDNGVTYSAPLNVSNNATASFGNDRPKVTAGPNGV